MRGAFRRRKREKISSKKGVFNPEDATRVKHTRLGVWDLYEEKTPKLEHIPGSSKLEALLQLKDNLPYVWRMLLDIGSLKSCWTLLILYCLLTVMWSFIPAISLWYKAQLLTVVQTAVDSRTVDKDLLARMTLGTLGCRLAERLFQYARGRVAHPLGNRVNKHYSVRLFEASARLDIVTFDDPAVQRQIDSASSVNGQGVAWGTISMVTSLVSTSLKILTQVSVLVEVLRSQRDGLLLATLSMLPTLNDYMELFPLGSFPGRGVWAATTKNEAFVRMAGLAAFVHDSAHRKELVAGNMAEYATEAYKQAVKDAGDYASDFWDSVRDHWNRSLASPMRFIRDCLGVLPQITFALRAVQYPESVPVSLASLTLIVDTTESFAWELRELVHQTGSIVAQLSTVRKLYEIGHIPNKVPDGDCPFPENAQLVEAGINLEFRHVYFRYPGATEFALQDVSFKVHQGQLCVIVGSNGSGKSTILKLAVRLYDVTEGEILIDGKDIRTLKLKDLRQAISVLFQDYTHFPLSIRDNIGLGDPSHAEDDDKIRLAARLGGAEEFVDRLPAGFNTYLRRPVQDYYSALPEGTKTLFGRPVDYNSVRNAGGMGVTSASPLSGGQMQRLAVSRTFMRSVVSEDSQVGLLLFDEPSASLDPTAEHDLFKRLRLLRGSKTMIFSSHRFGNLTRDADVILYMNDSKIVESGRHDELLKLQGEYARIWTLQAQAFLP